MYVGLVFLTNFGVCGVFCSVAGSWVVGRPQRGGTNLGVFVPIWPATTPASSWLAIKEQTHPMELAEIAEGIVDHKVHTKTLVR